MKNKNDVTLKELAPVLRTHMLVTSQQASPTVVPRVGQVQLTSPQ